MLIEKKTLSVHIEKTAGTSLENFYLRTFGSDMVLVWNPNSRHFSKPSEKEMSMRGNIMFEGMRNILQRTPFMPLIHQFREVIINKGRSQIPPSELLNNNFKVAHGHFLATDFKEYLPDRFTTIILRSPVDRMVSHYKYWLQTRGNASQRINIPFNEDMTYRDFALLSKLQNFQSQAIAGLDLEKDFGLVGTTEKINQFTRKLLQIFGIPILSYKQYQLPIIKKSIPMDVDDHIAEALGDASFQSKFAKFHEDDLRNYAIAKKLA